MRNFLFSFIIFPLVIIGKKYCSFFGKCKEKFSKTIQGIAEILKRLSIGSFKNILLLLFDNYLSSSYKDKKSFKFSL